EHERRAPREGERVLLGDVGAGRDPRDPEHEDDYTQQRARYAECRAHGTVAERCREPRGHHPRRPHTPRLAPRDRERGGIDEIDERALVIPEREIRHRAVAHELSLVEEDRGVVAPRAVERWLERRGPGGQELER